MRGWIGIIYLADAARKMARGEAYVRVYMREQVYIVERERERDRAGALCCDFYCTARTYGKWRANVFQARRRLFPPMHRDVRAPRRRTTYNKDGIVRAHGEPRDYIARYLGWLTGYNCILVSSWR